MSKRKFVVELQETNYKIVEVEAKDFAEAAELAGQMYEDGEVLMDDPSEARLDAVNHTDADSTEVINIF